MAATRSQAWLTALPFSRPAPTPARRPPRLKSSASMCVASIVRAEAKPGQIDLRPPVKPAK